MCKSEIFAKIIALVSKGTEIPTELTVSDNRVTEIVNARYILVYILYEKGFYPSQISSLIHKCYLDDIDGDPCRAFDESFATCIGKGIPVIWSDVI